MRYIQKRTIIDALNRRLGPLDIGLFRQSEIWRAGSALGLQPTPTSTHQAIRSPTLRVFGDPASVSAFDVSVVMTSILRPTIADAVRSVFQQDISGDVQTLIGIDQPGDLSGLESVCRDVPANHVLYVFDPGYSTSVRHGGLHPAWDGGALRTILSYLAASRRVAYLDDDNWLAPDHLSALAAALEGHEWSWSLRWYIHPTSRRVICEDAWDSMGPNAGIIPGGWVDPNSLMIDKIACEAVLRWWTIPRPNSRTGTDAERNIFRMLRTQYRGRGSGARTSFYVINEKDGGHAGRVARIGPERYKAAGMQA